MIDPLSPYTQLHAPGRIRPLLLGPLTLAAVALVGCSGAEDDQGTPETDAGAAPPVEITMDTAYLCMDPNVYVQHQAECDSLGVAAESDGDGPSLPPSTAQECTDPAVREAWPSFCEIYAAQLAFEESKKECANPEVARIEPAQCEFAIPSTEGSESSYLWPTGIRTTIDEVVIYPNPENKRNAVDQPADTALDVTLTITNESDRKIAFGPNPGEMAPAAILYVGANGLDTINWAGSGSWPQRLVPGSSHSMTFEFSAMSPIEPANLVVSLSNSPPMASYGEKPTHTFVGIEAHA